MAVYLTPDKTRTEYGLTIKEKIIPWGAKYPFRVVDSNGTVHNKGELYKEDKLLSNGTGKPKGITVHNTEDINVNKATTRSEQYTRATWPNCAMNMVRVHYYCCQDEIWQNLLDTEVGWHATDGTKADGGNFTTIAIEIIGRNAKAEDRGAKLVAVLMKKYNLTINQIYPHKHWYPVKYCPAYILPHWDTFLKTVQKYYDEICKMDEPKEKVEKVLYRVRTEWAAVSTQKGAYYNLDSAKELADKFKAYGYKVYDEKGKIVYNPIQQPTVDKKTLYRVRTDWKAVSTQVGAYYSIDSAKELADSKASLGYKVFDESGNIVYTPTIKVETNTSTTTSGNKTVKYIVTKKAPVKYEPTATGKTQFYYSVNTKLSVYETNEIKATNGTVWVRFYYSKAPNKSAWIPKTYIKKV